MVVAKKVFVFFLIDLTVLIVLSYLFPVFFAEVLIVYALFVSTFIFLMYTVYKSIGKEEITIYSVAVLYLLNEGVFMAVSKNPVFWGIFDKDLSFSEGILLSGSSLFSSLLFFLKERIAVMIKTNK